MAEATDMRAALGEVEPVPFPGRVITVGDEDRKTVLAIQRRLTQLGCGPLEDDGDFGPKTKAGVQLFQARFTDTDGLPLKVDGKVGAITWAALFGAESAPMTEAAEDPLLARVLEVAASQIGVMEEPPGSNRGPKVDQYLSAVGLDPTTGSFPWCAAFVYWCFAQAGKALNRENPVICTAQVLDHWRKAGERGVRRVLQPEAVNNPALVKPGQIFVIATGAGNGHTGLVERTSGGKLVTIEGNTNVGGSREGIGVFRRESRKTVDINRGFIDYAGA
jgi:hypothetical protein